MSKKIRLSVWANRIGVSLNTAITWARAGRIEAEHLMPGVWIIDMNQIRPKPMRPWANKRAERISRH